MFHPTPPTVTLNERVSLYSLSSPLSCFHRSSSTVPVALANRQPTPRLAVSPTRDWGRTSMIQTPLVASARRGLGWSTRRRFQRRAGVPSRHWCPAPSSASRAGRGRSNAPSGGASPVTHTSTPKRRGFQKSLIGLLGVGRFSVLTPPVTIRVEVRIGDAPQHRVRRSYNVALAAGPLPSPRQGRWGTTHSSNPTPHWGRVAPQRLNAQRCLHHGTPSSTHSAFSRTLDYLARSRRTGDDVQPLIPRRSGSCDRQPSGSAYR